MNLDTVIFPQHEMAHSKWSTEPFLSIDASRGQSYYVLFFCQRQLRSALSLLLGAPQEEGMLHHGLSLKPKISTQN